MHTLYSVTTSVACLIANQPVVPVFRQNFIHTTYKTNMPEILTSTAVALFWIRVIKSQEYFLKHTLLMKGVILLHNIFFLKH